MEQKEFPDYTNRTVLYEKNGKLIPGVIDLICNKDDGFDMQILLQDFSIARVHLTQEEIEKMLI